MIALHKRCFYGLLVMASLMGCAMAQTTVGAVGLRAEAQSDSKVVQKLTDKAAVKVLKRQGFWLEVEAAGAKGWLKVSEISFGSGASAAGGLGGLETGRTGKGNIVSTSAARGLTAKELVAAKPDPKQVAQLKGLAVTASAADAFAKAGGLTVRKVDLVPGATPPANASTVKRSKPTTSDDGDDDDD